MRTTARGTMALAALLGISTLAAGQGALERLEKNQFGGNKPAAKKAEAAKPAEPGYLGVVTDDAKDRGRGVRVVELVVGSAADKAGIAVDDLITAINDKPVRQMTDVPKVMQGAAAGAEIGITLIRDGKTRTVHVTLGRRPADANVPPPPPAPAQPGAGNPPARPPAAVPQPAPNLGPPLLGAVMRTYLEDPRLVFGRPPLRGAMITETIADTPAATAGLRPGDVIVAINGRGVADFQDLQETIARYRPGSEVQLSLYRGRVQFDRKVRLGSAAAPRDNVINDRPAEQPTVDALRQRVRELEQRIADLEKKLGEKGK